MKKDKTSYTHDKSKTRKKTGFPGVIYLLSIILILFLINSCEEKPDNQSNTVQLKEKIQLIVPSDLADSVVVDPVLAITFKEGIDSSFVSSSTIVLKKGLITVPGSITYSGTTASFKSGSDLSEESEYTATVKSKSPETREPIEYTWKFRTGKHHSYNSLAVVSVMPLTGAVGVPVNTTQTINFNLELTPMMTNQIHLILASGTSYVEGKLAFSGKTATFKPTVNLEAGKLYVGRVAIGFNYEKIFTWSFTTAGITADVKAPTVTSVVPANNSTSVATTAAATVIFSEAMNSLSLNSSTFTLKQGTNAIAGTVTSTESTAKFTPSLPLEANKIYTATVLKGAKDIAGNALAVDYLWNFTTASVTDVTAPTVLSVVPLTGSSTSPITVKPVVTFSEPMTPATINSTSYTLKQGSTAVTGTVAYTGSVATFSPTASLAANTLYTATVTTSAKDISGNALAANYSWSFTTASAADVTAPTVSSVLPLVNSTSVAVNIKPSVVFSEAMTVSSITASTFTLKQGTASVSGTVTLAGQTASFTPSAALASATVYTATVTTGAKDAAGNALAAAYTWNFTTAAPSDVTPPTVTSVAPLTNATSIAVNVKPSVTFSEAMTASSISTSTFTLKQGSALVSGTVTLAGSTATFSPSAALASATVYTATITTGVKDAAGNALTAAYSWNFTTAAPSDVTPPSVSSISPSANSSSIAVTAKASVTFSEAMNASTITASTFTMKQGSATVSGNVTYSGTTATFTPSASLAVNTVYTCTVTTGAKDLAGNAIMSAYSWSFTTVVPAPSGKSFSAEVVPILNLCNTCHNHGWSPSSNASTFYTNLVNAGYVNPTNPTSSKIYSKLSGGHPGSTVTSAQVNTILTWMTEGSKNN